MLTLRGLPLFIHDGCKNPLTFFPLDYVKSDYRLITVKLKNAYKRCCDLGFDGTPEDYAALYESVWRTYRSTVLRLSFDDVVSAQDWFEHYDNIIQLTCLVPDHLRVHNDSLDGIMNAVDFHVDLENNTEIFNPNTFSYRQLKTQRLTEIYRKSYKKRKVTNFSMSNLYGDV